MLTRTHIFHNWSNRKNRPDQSVLPSNLHIQHGTIDHTCRTSSAYSSCFSFLCCDSPITSNKGIIPITPRCFPTRTIDNIIIILIIRSLNHLLFSRRCRFSTSFRSATDILLDQRGFQHQLNLQKEIDLQIWWKYCRIYP